MTRPSALVLDGNEVKLRLIAERVESRTPVHVDWVRFTVQRRYAAARDPADWFAAAGGDAVTWEALQEFAHHLAQVPDCDYSAAEQARDLATECARALGPDFVVAPDVRKGHDFYRYRWAIERNGAEVGWVGFQASSESPKQQAQARTLHANLHGAACTFALAGWRERIADIVEARDGTLTRVDLALDFFDGYDGGIARVHADYNAGRMNSRGHRPKFNQVGDWSDFSAGGRSLYFGSKEAGKQTNVYEKGDQLFGVGAGSKWLRFELRYGNKLRELSPDMLRRPADFFAGASDWHAAVLAEADAIVVPQPVPQAARLPLETVKAEVTRIARWVKHTAGPAVAFCVSQLGDEWFCQLAEDPRLPGRLRRLAPSSSELSRAVQALIPPVESTSPAFA